MNATGGTTTPHVYSGFALYAERAAGSGQLWIDHYILVPVSEGHLHISDMTAWSNGTAGHYDTSLLVNPKGEANAWNTYSYYSAELADSSGVSLDTWHMPNDAALLILAANRAGTASTLDTQLSLRFIYYNRYRTLRGA